MPDVYIRGVSRVCPCVKVGLLYTVCLRVASKHASTVAGRIPKFCRAAVGLGLRLLLILRT